MHIIIYILAYLVSGVIVVSAIIYWTGEMPTYDVFSIMIAWPLVALFMLSWYITYFVWFEMFDPLLKRYINFITNLKKKGNNND